MGQRREAFWGLRDPNINVLVARGHFFFDSTCHRDSFDLCDLLACQFLFNFSQANCIKLPAP